MRLRLCAYVLAFGVSASAYAAAPTPPPTSGTDEPQHRSPPDIPDVTPPEREPAPPDIVPGTTGVPGTGDVSGTGGAQEAGGEEIPPSEPGELLASARAAIPTHPVESARQLEQVSRQMEQYRTLVTGSTRERLAEAHEQLDQLAFDIRSKDVKSPDQANPPISEAYSAIASFHGARASDQWERRDQQKASQELDAAAHYLERAAELTPRGPSTATTAAVRGARNLANELAEGSQVAPSDVDRALGDLGQAIDRVTRQTRPQPRTR